MTTRPAVRHYAYSESIGRMRVPDHITDTAEIIAWATARRAVNVVREEGPASKPTGVAIVWEREDAPPNQRLADVMTLLAKQFPDASVRTIGETALAIWEMYR